MINYTMLILILILTLILNLPGRGPDLLGVDLRTDLIDIHMIRCCIILWYIVFMHVFVYTYIYI